MRSDHTINAPVIDKIRPGGVIGVGSAFDAGTGEHIYQNGYFWVEVMDVRTVPPTRIGWAAEGTRTAVFLEQQPGYCGWQIN